MAFQAKEQRKYRVNHSDKLKLRAISRRMDSLLNTTKSGKLCMHLWDVLCIADEVSLIIGRRDSEHYQAAEDFVGAFDTHVMDSLTLGENTFPFTFTNDEHGGTWEGSITDLSGLPCESVQEAKLSERRLRTGLTNISNAFGLGEVFLGSEQDTNAAKKAVQQ